LVIVTAPHRKLAATSSISSSQSKAVTKKSYSKTVRPHLGLDQTGSDPENFALD
jgi:hypothetical protein